MEEGRTVNEAEKSKKARKRILLLINILILAIGNGGAPMVTRLYFIHGGQRIWLSSFLLTAGFPILLLPLAVSYIQRRRNDVAEKPKLVSTTPTMILGFGFAGILCGVSNYLYSFGMARLPVSTSSLIIASQLAFTAVFAFVLVRQKFTSYSVNAIVLLTLAAAVLALHGGNDRPAGESSKQYLIGFILTLMAAVLSGLTFPLVEFMYKKIINITYSLVMELQFVMCVFGTLFCFVGMIADNDFKVIPREAREFGLGEVNYYIVLVMSAILWQLYLLGAIGVVFCASSLFSGIIIAVLLPITEVLAVIFFKEKFQAEKGLSLALSIWGFVSYFYGEFKQARETRKNSITETELPVNNHSSLDP